MACSLDPDSDFSDAEDQSPFDSAFNKASDHVRKNTEKLATDQLLMLYGLYKQGTEGNCNISRPSWLNIQGRQKWDAWKALEDMSVEEAKEKYVELVQKLDPEWTELMKPKSGPKENWVAVSSLRYSPEPELDSNELSLLDAAREDCGKQVERLLMQNPELKSEKDDDGMTALHWAADRDATKALVAALKGGCSVDAVDESGQTALHYAASCGHLESAKLLLLAGASPVIKDNEGSTPLDQASDDSIRELLQSAVK